MYSIYWKFYKQMADKHPNGISYGSRFYKSRKCEKNSICILYVIEDSYGRRRKPSEDDGNSQNFMEGCLWSIERNFRNIKI